MRMIGELNNRKLATNIHDDGDAVSIEGLTAVGPEIGAIVEVQIAGPQAGLRLKTLDYLEKTKTVNKRKWDNSVAKR